jgi:O-antigen/teichoic acid export membrane protein
MWAKWKPSLIFSIESFKELFSFGNKLLISGLIDTAYRNIYYLIIGKYFSVVELGYYTRADQFQALPSQQLTGVFGRVSFPILSTIQDDLEKLRAAYRQIIKSTMFITFVLMLGMAAIAKPMIVTLIGEQWLPVVIYLQMLCFVGMFYPLHALNLNMLKVQGRSDLFLRLEIIKKVLAVPVIIIGILYGIKIMILGMLINTIFAYFINSFWSGKFIGYSSFEQVKDIFPSFLLAFTVAVIVFIFGNIIDLPNIWILVTQITVGAVSTIILAETFKLNSYLYLKEIIINKLGQLEKNE